jgi:hypothetical protein
MSGNSNIDWHRLGNQFIELPQFDLSSSFDHSAVGVALIFILSVGAAPTTYLLRVAGKKIHKEIASNPTWSRSMRKKRKQEC